MRRPSKRENRGRLIKEETKRRLGGHHNAPSLMVTVDFADVERLQQEGDWEQLATLLATAAPSLERGGADFIVLCTNTMHKVANSIVQAVRIPLVHIVDATAAAIKRSRQKRAGLLGTRFTMEEAFYVDRMRNQFGIEVIVPPPESRRLVHEVIYQMGAVPRRDSTGVARALSGDHQGSRRQRRGVNHSRLHRNRTAHIPEGCKAPNTRFHNDPRARRRRLCLR